MNNQLESLLSQIKDLHSQWQCAENLITEIRNVLGIRGITILEGIKNLQNENARLQKLLEQKEMSCRITGCILVPAGTTDVINIPGFKSADLVITEDGRVLKNRWGGFTGKITQNKHD